MSAHDDDLPWVLEVCDVTGKPVDGGEGVELDPDFGRAAPVGGGSAWAVDARK